MAVADPFVPSFNKNLLSTYYRIATLAGVGGYSYEDNHCVSSCGAYFLVRGDR